MKIKEESFNRIIRESIVKPKPFNAQISLNKRFLC